MSLTDKLVHECIELLKQEKVKEQFKDIFKPLLNCILQELYPYIFLSLIFMIISFIMILSVFIMNVQTHLRPK
jgi:hypothetical protein